MKISFCGLDCDACEAFVATKNHDAALRAEVAKKWEKQFGHPIPPEEIHCVGCTVEGKHINYCESMCEIRRCGKGRGLATCAECADFDACAHLEAFFKLAPQAKTNLSARRKGK